MSDGQNKIRVIRLRGEEGRNARDQIEFFRSAKSKRSLNGDNSFPAPPPESPEELSRRLAPPNVNTLFLTSSYIVLLY